jgi:hypothetical protein
METTPQTIYDVLTPTQINTAVFFVAIAILMFKFREYIIGWILRRFSEKTKGSVLLAAFTRGKTVHPMAVAPIAGYPSYVFMTEHGVVLSVELPFHSDVQLVGFSSKSEPRSDEIRAVTNEYGLEKVVLEGNFPNYFEVYTEPTKQTDVRVPMNPKTMAYLVDFCQSHTWEVRDNMLSFASSDKLKKEVDDPTVMAADVKSFVEHIRTSRLRT